MLTEQELEELRLALEECEKAHLLNICDLSQRSADTKIASQVFLETICEPEEFVAA
jgi:hypothetical protein